MIPLTFFLPFSLCLEPPAGDPARLVISITISSASYHSSLRRPPPPTTVDRFCRECSGFNHSNSTSKFNTINSTPRQSRGDPGQIPPFLLRAGGRRFWRRTRQPPSSRNPSPHHPPQPQAITASGSVVLDPGMPHLLGDFFTSPFPVPGPQPARRSGLRDGSVHFSFLLASGVSVAFARWFLRFGRG